MPASRRKILDHVFSGLSSRMSRRKKTSDDTTDMPLRRSMSTLDLTLLGIGNMMAVGVYVISGTVARDYAGPGVVLCFLFAGVSGLLACLNYAELGAIYPRAGSTYAFVYASVGEFWAFFTGWNLLMEHMIGAAALARAWAGYLDSLTNGAVRNFTRGLLGAGAAGVHLGSLMHPSTHSQLQVEVDILAVGIVVALTLLIAMGTRGAQPQGSVLVILNLAIIAMSVIFGFLNADIENWRPQNDKGFLPFGWDGILIGSAVCMYAFSGLESVLQGGQESRRSAYSVPSALLMSNAITLSGYLLLSAALTLATPYSEICPAASLACALGRAGMHWARWPVTCGALLTMSSALLCILMQLPKAIHAMAMDGLLFSFLGKLNAKTHVPLTNLVLVCIMVSTIAFLFNLPTLVGMLSIGTIVSHLSLASAVIHSRYRPLPSPPQPQVSTPAVDSSSGLTDDSDSSGVSELASPVSDVEYPGALKPGAVLLRKLGLQKYAPGTVVKTAYAGFVTTGLAFTLFRHVTPMNKVTFCGDALFAIVLVLFLLVIDAHQQTSPASSQEFRSHGVPFITGLSMFINMQLLMSLPILAYIRFFIWTAIGFVVYFLYGIRHSSEAERRSSYGVLLAGKKSVWGGGPAPTPATAPMLHAPQPPSHHDKLPILDYDELND